ncbi:MAG: glycosyltransferase family 9 protein [Endomicrobium sp.]|jgi:ADP-heptose:LPS heptosyltransferase|nr:glycosyltransferase family 9 protein [Endomicrobium sp.]
MKILIIKPSSFGDIVQALPCANALKQIYHGCEISWVVFNRWSSIITICPDIDKIIIWDRKKGLKGFFDVLKKVSETEYDLIIDLQGLLRSALLAKFARAKIKLGVPGMKESSKFLIKEVYPKSAMINATLRNLELVHFLTGKKFYPEINIKVNTNSNKILQDNGVSGYFISLFPFARGKGKDWSVFNYNKLINLIKREYFDIQIVVLGVIKDFGKIRSDKIVDLCGKTKIENLAGILLKSKIAIGADTGPMHLSSVLQIPSIFIFGNSNINETAPCIGKFSLLLNNTNPKNINDIKPETVFAEIKKWIN